MAVGDVNSAERGSGARFNGGKVRLDYVPARVLADFYMVTEPRTLTNSGMIELLNVVACFEERVGGPELTLLARALNLTLPLIGGVDRFRATADVFDFGAGKYAPWNWAKGMAWSIPLACIKRHAVKIIEGEANDEESGLDHRGHIGCNIVMLMHYVHNYREGDDRPSRECFAKDEYPEPTQRLVEAITMSGREVKVETIPAADIYPSNWGATSAAEALNYENGDGRCNDPSCLCNRWAEIDHELRPIPGPVDVEKWRRPCEICGHAPCMMSDIGHS